MHIAFLTDNFPPEVNAPATRTFEHCREWVRLGHKVTVITGAPNFPSGRVFMGFRNRIWSHEIMDGISVVRVWTYITANSGFAKRTLDYASFMVSAIPASLALRHVDVIVGTSPQLFTPCAAFIAGLLKRRPYVFELRDLWPDSIQAVGAISNSIILNMLEALELFLYRRATSIVTVTQAFRANLINRGIPPEKISVTMNGADLSRFMPHPRDHALAQQLGLGDNTVVGYVGTLGMAHALLTVLKAAEQLKSTAEHRGIRFLFLGNGAEKAALMAYAAEKQLNNVLFLDSVPRADVVRYWSLVDIAVIHLKRVPLFESVIPSKLFECMAMGIPVLHGVAGESAEIVRRERVGIVFEPENADVLAQLIVKLAGDQNLRTELGSHGAIAARKYDRTSMALAMLRTLEQAAEQRGAALPGGASNDSHKGSAAP